jgi:hypothetical protein
MKKNWLFYLVLVITFLIGGSMQLVGLGSNSLLTIGISLLILLDLLFKLIVKRRYLPIKIFPFLVITILILVSSAINYTRLDLWTFYFWVFVAVPFTVYYLVKSNLGNFDFNKLINFLIFVAVLQLPVMMLQGVFYKQLATISARSIAEVDISYGTFFLANDHALGYLVLSLTTFLLFNNYKTQYFHKFVYIGYFVLTILVSNSKISFLLLSIILIAYFLLKADTKMIVGVSFGALLLIAVVTVLPDFYNFVEEKTVYIMGKVSSGENEAYLLQKAIEKGNADRTQIFYYYVNHPLRYFGEGPYNYYNPVTKKFNLFPNFSQFLWFYNDLGIFSITGIVFFYLSLYLRNNKLLSYKVMYLIMILVYSYFANTLADLAFSLIFFIFISYDIKKVSHKIKRYNHEPSLHPIL